jgi:RNase P/RNase MRP subunit p30
MRYFDLHVVYNEKFRETIDALSNCGYSGVCASFKGSDAKAIRVARNNARDLGLDFYSRYNIAASVIGEFNRQVSRFEGRFDYLAIDRVPLQVIMKANLRKISIVDLNTIGFRAVKKLRSQGNKTVIEFCLKRFSALSRSDYNSAQRMIRSASFYDRSTIPMVITSGAEHPLDVKPPLQLLYTFLGLIRREHVNKIYVSNPLL